MGEVNLFTESESGFFTCARVRPPPAPFDNDSTASSEVAVVDSRTVRLASLRQRHVRTGVLRPDAGSSTFTVDGALRGSCTDDEA